MKNKEIVDLYNGLSNLNLKGVKFSYAVAKNLSLLKTEVESLQKALEASEQFKEYDKERAELAEKHAKKDSDGKALTKKDENGTESYVIEDQSAFDKEYIDIKDKYKDAISDRENQIKDFNELIEKENTVTLFKINIKDVPEDITTKQLTTIISLIED